jgi:hypothetical protein
LLTYFIAGAVVMFAAIWHVEERNRRRGGHGFGEIRWMLLVLVLLLLIVPLGKLLAAIILGLLAVKVFQRLTVRRRN